MGGIGSGRYRWPSRACTVEECVVLAIRTVHGGPHFTVRVQGEPVLVVDAPSGVELHITVPHFGGVRWWMTCPLVGDGAACGRPVAKLYRPPGRAAWGCRHCHGLTYRSAQENHRHTGLTALVARDIPGATPGVVQRLLIGGASDPRARWRPRSEFQ